MNNRSPQLLAVLPINAPVSRLYKKVLIVWPTDMLGGFSYGFINSAVTIFGSLATILARLTCYVSIHLDRALFRPRGSNTGFFRKFETLEGSLYIFEYCISQRSPASSFLSFFFAPFPCPLTLPHNGLLLGRQQLVLRRHQVD